MICFLIPTLLSYIRSAFLYPLCLVIHSALLISRYAFVYLFLNTCCLLISTLPSYYSSGYLPSYFIPARPCYTQREGMGQLETRPSLPSGWLCTFINKFGKISHFLYNSSWKFQFATGQFLSGQPVR